MDYEHTMQLYDQARQKKQFLETAEYLDYKKGTQMVGDCQEQKDR